LLNGSAKVLSGTEMKDGKTPAHAYVWMAEVDTPGVNTVVARMPPHVRQAAAAAGWLAG
jgi:hypothetical protein